MLLLQEMQQQLLLLLYWGPGGPFSLGAGALAGLPVVRVQQEPQEEEQHQQEGPFRLCSGGLAMSCCCFRVRDY